MNSWDQYEKLLELGKELKNFDSSVLIQVPQPEISTPELFRGWWAGVERQWINEYNDSRYSERINWNDEYRIYGKFGDFYLDAKFYRYDGSQVPFWENDFRSERGVQIREHYGVRDVAKVHLIANNLEEFLKQQNINYGRLNFEL